MEWFGGIFVTTFIDGDRMKILIVDDSKVARMSVERLINGLNEGHVIIEGVDVPTGLEAIADGLPDVAFIDLNMPGPDGLHLVQALIDRGMSPQHIAVLTANIQNAVRERVSGLGAHFIAKPLSSDTITAFLEQVNKVD